MIENAFETIDVRRRLPRSDLRLEGRWTPMDRRTRTVLVSGSSGLVGRRLLQKLAEREQPTKRLVRPGTAPIGTGPKGVFWDPAAGKIDAASAEADAVVHLAGENISDGRWTRSKMEAIRSSRVRGTKLLAETLARLEYPPEVLVSASAIGFYGDRGAEILTERSGTGTGFLPEVCEAWEEATEPARRAGIRVVHLRIGVVLDPEGGALEKMLPPFRIGLGGRLGSGDQYMSWITLDDLVGAICHALDDEDLYGAVNATAPLPVTNREFTETLGRVLSRPTFAAVPGVVARLALGRMADDLLLASTRVSPARLMQQGFEFEHPKLEGALRSVLGEGR